MKRNSFKKFLALLTVLVMALGVVAVPNVSANADEAKGEINFANNYDWTGQSSNIYAFASASTDASIATLTGQGAGTFQWSTFIVLERNEDYNYVVTAIHPAAQGNTADATPLGEGKIIIMIHSDAAAAHQASYDFFMSLQVNDVLAASTYWENFAGATGVQTALSFTKATAGSVGPKAPTQGALNIANGVGDDTTAGTLIAVIVPNDANATLSTLTAGTPFPDLPYWYSFVVEKDATKGTWVVTASDLVAADGANACKDVALGEGKMLIAFHDAAADTESFTFFKASATVGREYYLVGEIPAAGGALDGVYLSLEKPADPEPENPNPEEPGTEEPGAGGDKIETKGDFDAMRTITLFMVAIALVSVGLVLKKRNNVA